MNAHDRRPSAETPGMRRVRSTREMGLTVVGPVAVALVVLVAAWYVLANISAADDAQRTARASLAVRADLAVADGLETDAAGRVIDVAALRALETSIIGNLEVAAGDAGRAERELLESLVRAHLVGLRTGATTSEDLLGALDGQFDALAMDASERADEASAATIRAIYFTAGTALVALLGAVHISGRIRARRADEAARGAAEDRHRALLENAPLLVYIVGSDGTLEYASPLAQQVYGRTVDRVEVLAGQLAPEFADFAASLVDQTVECGVNHRIRSARGIWFDVLVSDHRDHPAIKGLVITARDVSERVELENVLRRQATEDELTGITNRRGLDLVLDDALRDVAAADASVGVLLVDLDGFKEINDRKGHAAGDEALAQIGARLRGCTRAGEHVARYGGDEFAVVAHPLRSAAEAEAIASRLLDALRMPCVVDGDMVSVSASIGVAMGRSTDAPNDLLASADEGMYLAKRAGGASWSWSASRRRGVDAAVGD